MDLKATNRDIGNTTVVDISGRITLGEGSALLRGLVRQLLDHGRKHIVLNLADVNYIDSSGIGELVSSFTAVKKEGGELKLLNLTKKVHDLLLITKLFTVFDVHSDEQKAVASFPS
jgi:anti-sigma B factor antagonist